MEDLNRLAKLVGIYSFATNEEDNIISSDAQTDISNYRVALPLIKILIQ